MVWCFGKNRDHLVSLEVCCRPKMEGGLGLSNLVSKNIILATQWLWHFPLEPHSLWHQVIRSKYSLDKNGWDANTATQATHSNPWKFISQGYTTFTFLLSLEVVNGPRFNFWEDHCIGDSSFNLAFPHIYHLSSLHNSPIQNFHTVQDSTYSWDFHFFRNLNDRVL